MTMRRILLVSSAITTLPHHPVRIEFMDKPKAAPSTSKRAEVKAARKQKGHKPAGFNNIVAYDRFWEKQNE